ncbi:MAG: hypothetical protein ACK5LN_14335 [Propioniciclava sp.]
MDVVPPVVVEVVRPDPEVMGLVVGGRTFVVGIPAGVVGRGDVTGAGADGALGGRTP